MLVVSNHLIGKGGLSFPDDVVIRVNVAWIPEKEELVNTLKKITHNIYLDYPQGRTKPPKPRISLADTIEIAHQFSQVKYFAVSNVEDPQAIYTIKAQLPQNVGLVPKIETKIGIENLEQIAEKINPSYIMLDKEDLYMDVNRNPELFQSLVEIAREKSKILGIEVLELHGVIFLPFQQQQQK